MNDQKYHIPVMLTECIEGLNINPEGIYVDATFGGGGHSSAIVEKLTSGKLFAFDQDPDAKKNADVFPEKKFQLIEANFEHIKKFLKLYGINKVDGIIADLGISSHQIDEFSRGFSFRENADLDMRMGQSGNLTAKIILNTYSEKELQKLFSLYGEVKNAKTLAHEVVRARASSAINMVDDLLGVLEVLAPRGKYNRYFAQVFQALRIEVNGELDVLEKLILQTVDLLKERGRLVVMSYHSLEDRPVKSFIAKGVLSGNGHKDFYGKLLKPLDALNRKPIEASPEEQALNNRSRSAKLRVAERNQQPWPIR
jgi:16S rRNA (cytosine1402-N4)-methyltransferase